MTRMVEEERTQIGTLKALGYNKIQITSKYIIYASLACIIGGFFGNVYRICYITNNYLENVYDDVSNDRCGIRV